MVLQNESNRSRIWDTQYKCHLVDCVQNKTNSVLCCLDRKIGGPSWDAVQKYIEDFQAMQKCVETERVVELEKQIRELKKTIEVCSPESI